MGNTQPMIQPSLVSRPYDAICKNISQTLPSTIVKSYQKTEEAQTQDENRLFYNDRVHEIHKNGCCFQPTGESSVDSVPQKRDSIWDYGEFLGNELGTVKKNNDEVDTREQTDPSLSIEASTNDTNEDSSFKERIVEKRNIIDLMKSVEQRSEMNIRIYGSINNHKPFLESQILDHLLPFILDSTLSRCFIVCPHWLWSIYGHLRYRCKTIVESFQRVYCQHEFLKYESSTFNIQPIFTAEVAAVRIDFLIYCKVLPSCQNHCTQIGYSFSYASTPVSPVDHTSVPMSSTNITRDDQQRYFNSDSIHEDPLVSTRLTPESPLLSIHSIIPPISSSYNARREYQAQFRFETIRTGSKRQIWIQRDMCRFHGDELMVASMSNVPTICVGDLIEIPVNIANAFGLVDVNTISWFPLEFISDPYRQFGQHCELERPKQLWLGLDQFQPSTNERLQNNDHFGPQWKHVKTDFTGIDVVLSRSKYSATEIGEVPNAKRWLGLEACVRDAKLPIVCALTRLGLQHDRFSMKHFRQGDSIWLYVSQGGGVLQ